MVNATTTRRLLMTAALIWAMGSGAAQAQMAEANVLQLEDGETVPVTMIPAGVYLRAADDPGDDIWARVPEYQVMLEPAPAVHMSVALRQDEAEGNLPLAFSVVSDRERLYVRLRWRDDSRDVATTGNRFRDGAAVQFALDDDTSHMMGIPSAPVNIWYWRSDSDTAENLAAGGPGSTTMLREQSVTAAGTHQAARIAGGREWTVVLSRALPADGPYQVDFGSRSSALPIAFAVWQGDQGQRDGHKRASTGWILVDLGPLGE